MRKSFPTVGELVIGIVRTIEEHGVIVELEEYEGLEAYVPRSHIASGRVRDIRDFVKEGERVVGRVIRADRQKGLVDISLRYVSRDQARRKLAQWKEKRRIISLIRMAAERLGRKDPEKIAVTVWNKLARYYDSPMEAIIEAMRTGPDVLKKAGLEDELAQALLEEARSHITTPIYMKVIGIKLISFAPNGVEVVRKALLQGIKAVSAEDEVEVDIYSVGSPKYVVRVKSADPKAVRRISSEVVGTILKAIKREGGIGEVAWEKSYKKRIAPEK
ncbi:MAG TPA: translation initiation factor IF-2 subunit alpha [Candidatus Korarchaeota archaeon]|nr:translation initiation factor IF-2 subunit alpha [Candidatus Korarchaeota archaeon]